MSALLPSFILLVLTALNALYVAAEFATVGARRSRLQERADGGNAKAKTLAGILHDPRRLDDYVAACQVGITLTSLLSGAYGQAQLAPLLTPYLGEVGGAAAATVVVLLIITVLQVVLGELLPKTVALRYPERLALALLKPMQFSLVLFRPLITLLNGAASQILRRVGVGGEHSHTHVHSPDELQALFSASAKGGLIDAAERQMLAGVLNIEDRVVREIMTPRTRLVTVGHAEHLADALGRLSTSAYTRFPVIGEGGIDDVVGVVNLRTLYLRSRQRPEAAVATIMYKPLIVADATAVPLLWRKLREAGRHSAIVVDEYGGVAGMVTLEDAIEEIFGDLQDEFDQEDEAYSQVERRVSVRGDLLIDDVNAELRLELPTEEADTISGLIWAEMGRLPMVGDEVRVGELVMRVESMERRAVRRISFDREDNQSIIVTSKKRGEA
ncbi:HlyC/CorC family transporter [Deinococcus detaillensis]|uniref:HlyC/CorC family transporter n=1 Tax=Deinococcus detaillensis TaxID=2592048 RepID=A0A553UGQ6_9DEIO|nr:hemolysin family protein [Deinococcus detaillensis]TSA79392.1 HlyC/CorC family transporter [Deinococcus detaillensis]